MSTRLESVPASVVRNTAAREKGPTLGDTSGQASDAAILEYSDKHYYQLLPVMAEKLHREKTQQEKLKE
ncbi:hypothetical protein Tco_1461194, partial [Tanacetum coccineum]